MSQFYLVAPSGYCINQQAAARGVERLQQAVERIARGLKSWQPDAL